MIRPPTPTLRRFALGWLGLFILLMTPSNARGEGQTTVRFANPARTGWTGQEDEASESIGVDPQADRERLEELIQRYLEVYGESPDRRDVDATPTAVADPAVIAEGLEAFEDHCTWCHDANRALEKTQTRGQWLQTVRRMAARRGAEIPESKFAPIAEYLASLNAPEPIAVTEEIGDSAPRTSPRLFREQPSPSWLDKVDFHATLSPNWRGSARDRVLENEGFFPEVWAQVSFHPGGPISARVGACTTCHRGSEPESNRIEVAEAVIRLDVSEALNFGDEAPKIGVEGGRLLVPFGSPGEQGHAGNTRTVTRSLLFNMGQNVNRDELGPPLLPLPYSDEGVSIDVTVPVSDDVSARLDAYAINGLQGFSMINFFESRDYSDNNNEPAVGGRLGLTIPYLKLGASFMAGRLNEDQGGNGPTSKRLGYKIYGFDATANYKGIAFLQVDYAKRKSGQLIFQMDNPRDEEVLDGYSFLGSVRVLEDPGISITARWDSLSRASEIPPFGGVLTDTSFTVRRFTWGFNIQLPGGSLLIINHEHWDMPSELDNVDVVGVRWVVSF